MKNFRSLKKQKKKKTKQHQELAKQQRQPRRIVTKADKSKTIERTSKTNYTYCTFTFVLLLLQQHQKS